MLEVSFPVPVGSTHRFHGIDNHRFKLGKVVYEALENKNDDLRSYLESVEVTDGKGIFFRTAVDTVRVEFLDETNGQDKDGFWGYRLVSVKDGHVWLRIGSHANDWYYPTFIFEYTPRR